MKVTKSVNVTRCIDCPYYQHSMDGGVCEELEDIRGVYNGFVLPEGRTQIHPDCPLKN